MEKAEQDAEHLARALRALAHPVRLHIINRLSVEPNCCCGDVCRALPLAQSTISQHLKILCEAGLADYHRQGNRSRYRLNLTRLEEVRCAIHTITAQCGCDIAHGDNN